MSTRGGRDSELSCVSTFVLIWNGICLRIHFSLEKENHLNHHFESFCAVLLMQPIQLYYYIKRFAGKKGTGYFNFFFKKKSFTV